MRLSNPASSGTGLRPRGTFNPTTQDYQPGDAVSDGGLTYVCTTAPAALGRLDDAPGGYSAAFSLLVTNAAASALGGSTTVPVPADGADYVVRAHLEGAVAATVAGLALDQTDYTDVAVFYNDADTWTQIDLDADMQTDGPWGRDTLTLWFRLQAPLSAGATTPRVGPGAYALCVGHASPTVRRAWANIYPLADDFVGSVLDGDLWTATTPSGTTATVAGGTLTLACAEAAGGDVSVSATRAFGPRYALCARLAGAVFGDATGTAAALRTFPDQPFADVVDTLFTTPLQQVRQYSGGTGNDVSLGVGGQTARTLCVARDANGLAYGTLGSTDWTSAVPGHEDLSALPPLLLLFQNGNAATSSYDWVKVRPFVPAEPTVALACPPPSLDPTHWTLLAAAAPGTPTLIGPMTVDFADIPLDGSRKTLWTPQVGDMLLRFVTDVHADHLTQWDHGTLAVGQSGDLDEGGYLLQAAAGGLGNSGTSTLDLDICGDAGNLNANTSSYGTAIVFHTADPVQILFSNPGDDPQPGFGHVELYAVIARPVSP